MDWFEAPYSELLSDGQRDQATFLKGQVAAQIPYLRRRALALCRRRPDAEDLLQETLVRALAGIHTWQPGSDIRAWLFGIMRNTFLTGLTRAKRRGSAIHSLRLLMPEAAEDESELRLIIRDLARALGYLPSKQRSALTLVALEGTSYQAAAIVMGCSTDALRCHLARGRARLRALLDARPYQRPAPLRRSKIFDVPPGKMNGADRLMELVESDD